MNCPSFYVSWVVPYETLTFHWFFNKFQMVFMDKKFTSKSAYIHCSIVCKFTNFTQSMVQCITDALKHAGQNPLHRNRRYGIDLFLDTTKHQWA